MDLPLKQSPNFFLSDPLKKLKKLNLNINFFIQNSEHFYFYLMFGQTTFGHINSNPYNENRGQDLAQPLNQQNTMFNFQFQNQINFNQYMVPQQYNSQPQMPQFIQQQHPQQQQQQHNQNNDNKTPDFIMYLQQSEQYSENSITKSSKNTYD